MSTKVKVAVAICFIFHLICLKLGFIVPLVIQFTTTFPLYILYLSYTGKSYNAYQNIITAERDGVRKYRDLQALQVLQESLYKPSITYFIWGTQDFNDIIRKHVMYRVFLVKQIFIAEYTDLLPLVKRMIYGLFRAKTLTHQ
jgi:hypothetical protein